MHSIFLWMFDKADITKPEKDNHLYALSCQLYQHISDHNSLLVIQLQCRTFSQA
jgi:hypothetical protein